MNNNIDYVIPSARFFSLGPGGAVTHAKGIVEGLIANGFSVRLVAEDNARNYFESGNNFSLVSLGEHAKEGLISNISFVIRALSYLNIQSGNIIIRKNVYFLVALVLNPGFISALRKKNLILEVNGLSYDKPVGNLFARAVSFLLVIFNKLLIKGLGCKVYVVSDALKKQLTNGFISIDPSVVHIIQNGGPEWKGGELRSHTKDPEALNFLFFGKLQRYNDFKLLISVFRELRFRHPNVSLDIVGFGACREEIELLVKDVPNVTLHGPTSLQSLVLEGVVSARTVGVVPLIKDESVNVLSPIKLYEYISLGLPVLCSSGCKIPNDLLSSGVIFSYKAGCADALSEKVEMFLKKDFDWDDARCKAKSMSQTNSWQERMRSLAKLF